MVNLEKIREIGRIKVEETERPVIDKKILSLRKFYNSFGISVENTIEKYGNECFNGTQILKKEVFHQAMNNNLTIKNKEFLNSEGKKVGAHQSDKRTYIGYCLDLIFGWLIEDVILEFFQSKGIHAELCGADINRNFLNKEDLSTTADMKINGNFIEIIFDYGNYWNGTGRCDLRGNKFKRLLKEKSYLLGFSPNSNNGFIFRPCDGLNDFKFSESISGYGNKSGYTTDKIKEYMLPFNDLIGNICEIFKKK